MKARTNKPVSRIVRAKIVVSIGAKTAYFCGWAARFSFHTSMVNQICTATALSIPRRTTHRSGPRSRRCIAYALITSGPKKTVRLPSM